MSNKHERLADRFADIFMRLQSNEILSVAALALEYQVSEKTIRRDLTRMECYIPLIRQKGQIWLDNSHKFDLTHKEFATLLRLIGVHNLLPNMDIHFLRELIQKKSENLFQIKGYTYEDATQFEHIMQVLQSAIANHNLVSLEYKGTIRQVQPYKIIHHQGCWYFAGVQDDEIKTFRLSKITQLEQLSEQYCLDDDIKQIIDHSHGIWFGKQAITITIQVDAFARNYFVQKQILPAQKILEFSSDGGLLIQSTVYHQLQIFPIVRAWMPHLQIISPSSWHDDLIDGLKTYLQSAGQPK
ncbi:helix-turn-helix transcriptional regulator [Moraxella marmotae]|uniref:helix-turn-helix transcriptional regulator n=1 Tax=Moraxella marmotae TaxID=3344520 RepID=UPI0035F4F1F6